MQWESTEGSWWTPTPWTGEPWWSSTQWWKKTGGPWWSSTQWSNEPWWSSWRQADEAQWSSHGQAALGVSPNASTTAKTTKPKFCFRFQKDGCKLGDECPYLHEIKSAPSKASAPKPPGSSGDLFPLTASSVRSSQERLDLTVDSGAAVSAIPRDAAKSFPTVQDKEPKNYTSASGHAVPTLGSKRTVLRFQSGKTGAVEFDVMDVPKPLLSVSKVLQKGYWVIFDTDCSYIENKVTGEWFKLYERGGVFVLPSWLCYPNEGQAAKL